MAERPISEALASISASVARNRYILLPPQEPSAAAIAVPARVMDTSISAEPMAARAQRPSLRETHGRPVGPGSTSMLSRLQPANLGDDLHHCFLAATRPATRSTSAVPRSTRFTGQKHFARNTSLRRSKLVLIMPTGTTSIRFCSLDSPSRRVGYSPAQNPGGITTDRKSTHSTAL
jgi:hypothetical protein